jgi:hypothetical protein
MINFRYESALRKAFNIFSMNEHLTKLEQVAAMAMQGILASGKTKSQEAIVSESIEHAQALLSEVSRIEKSQNADKNPTYGGWQLCPTCGKPYSPSPTVKLDFK